MNSLVCTFSFDAKDFNYPNWFRLVQIGLDLSKLF